VRRVAAVSACARAAFHRLPRGLTIVELMIALAVVGVLALIAVPRYQDYRERVRIAQAKQDISTMSGVVANFFYDARAYPDSLAEAGLGDKRDPWGNPYGYLNVADGRARGQARKDHSLVPINTDFDLYSMGPDGRSAPP
jgi:general secretion pathway protein G